MRQQQQRAERPALPRDVEVEADPRLPAPGTVLTRAYGGTVHEIRILEAGFEYQGTSYRSLSRIAKKITGTGWNGFVFFGLSPRHGRPAAAPAADPAAHLAAAVGDAAAGTDGFVELKLAPLVESCVAGGAVLELSRADGARLELRFPAHEPVDVLGLVAAFVGRGA